MALQNLDISDSLLELGRYLKHNKEIDDFCITQCNKHLKVYIGDFLRKDIPTAEDTPYIVLTDFRKLEGQNVEFCTYSLDLYVGIGSNNIVTVELEEDITMPDLYDLTVKLMNLLQKVINDKEYRNRPISRIRTSGAYPISSLGNHWVGKLEIEWRIYQTLGTQYTEEL